MERLVKGDVVVLPFSDLSAAKKRPALVVATLKGNDTIACQISSHARKDDYSITLSPSDFSKGSLKVPSTIRPNKLFTADESLILYKAGSVKRQKLNEVTAALVKIFQSS